MIHMQPVVLYNHRHSDQKGLESYTPLSGQVVYLVSAIEPRSK